MQNLHEVKSAMVTWYNEMVKFYLKYTWSIYGSTWTGINWIQSVMAVIYLKIICNYNETLIQPCKNMFTRRNIYYWTTKKNPILHFKKKWKFMYMNKEIYYYFSSDNDGIRIYLMK